MSYKELKKETLSCFLEIKRINDVFLKKKDIVKNEVLDDLLRFMVFFEELERKEKNKELKLSEHKDALLQIKKYLSTLRNMM